MTDAAIRLRQVGKTYRLYHSGAGRLLEFVTNHPRHEAFTALTSVSLELGHGEVLGIVGRNGAGKSTLLKILAGTLMPSHGEVEVNGRIAALLELGSGFHPEMTGRENVFLYGAVLGLGRAEIQARLQDIIEFAGLADFIDRPVKTYSSGMYVRLAFSVATSVDPDILIIDEALSVGDGEFARRSFDRIIGFKERGKTIVFCSHSMYQVEAICNRVIWIDHGRVVLDGPPKVVCAAYNAHLAGSRTESALESIEKLSTEVPAGVPRLLGVTLDDGRNTGRMLALQSGESDLTISVAFSYVDTVPPPSVIVAVVGADGEAVSSALSLQDGEALSTARRSGTARAQLTFPSFSLLRGHYTVDVYLMCERGVHCYEQALRAGEFTVEHDGLEQGVVRLPHRWQFAAEQ